MFEKVVISGCGPLKQVVDPGLVAQSLVYYQRVQIILTSANLNALVQGLGLKGFRDLIECEWLDISLKRSTAATFSSETSKGTQHNFEIVTHAGHENRPNLSDIEFLDMMLTRYTGKGYWSKQTARKLSRKCSSINWNEMKIDGLSIPQSARQELFNLPFVRRMVELERFD